MTQVVILIKNLTERGILVFIGPALLLLLLYKFSGVPFLSRRFKENSEYNQIDRGIIFPKIKW